MPTQVSIASATCRPAISARRLSWNCRMPTTPCAAGAADARQPDAQVAVGPAPARQPPRRDSQHPPSAAASTPWRLMEPVDGRAPEHEAMHDIAGCPHRRRAATAVAAVPAKMVTAPSATARRARRRAVGRRLLAVGEGQARPPRQRPGGHQDRHRQQDDDHDHQRQGRQDTVSPPMTAWPTTPRAGPAEGTRSRRKGARKASDPAAMAAAPKPVNIRMPSSISTSEYELGHEAPVGVALRAGAGAAQPRACHTHTAAP